MWRGRVEVRLADHEVDDGAALAAQLVGAVGGGGARRRLDAPDALGERGRCSTGVVPSWFAVRRTLPHRGSPVAKTTSLCLIGIAYGIARWRLGGAGRAMNFRRLQYFVKIVDIGSLTQAADILHVAQPALEPAARDAGGRGAPAAAGADQARRDADRGRQGALPPRAAHPAPVRAGAGRHEGGRPGALGRGVGRARARDGGGRTSPCRCCAPCATRHPGIVLYLNETYGTTLSELIMNGRMDLAVLYGGTTAVHGLSFQLAPARAALPRRAAALARRRPRPCR